MSAVKRAVLLLMLAALGTEAAPGPDCDGLNRTLSKDDLHTIFGDWVLVWSVADSPVGQSQLSQLISSQLELQLQHDNKTITFNETNLLLHNSCTKYVTNLVSAEPSDSQHYMFKTTVAMVEADRVVQNFNILFEMVFFESCPNCLTIECNSEIGHYLLIYRRKGHHQDVEQLKASHSNYQKLSECLKLPHDKPFIYDGASDFCH